MNRHLCFECVLLLIMIISLPSCLSKKSLVMRPAHGDDTYVHELHSDRNMHYDNKIAVMAWTFKGTPAVCRGLLYFDFTSIPRKAKIDSAFLILHHVEDQGNNPQHSRLSGDNSAELLMITSAWQPDSVNWRNQPAADTSLTILLPASTIDTQDYRLNITTMVDRMVRAPASNFGFMIRLRNEQHYRALMFASSNHPKAELHPQLKVHYRSKG
jgi:hypothetical protein